MDNRGKRHTRIVSWQHSPMWTYAEQAEWLGMQGLKHPRLNKAADEWMANTWTYDTLSDAAKQWMKENVKDWEDEEALYSAQYKGKKLRFRCKRCTEWYSISYSHCKPGGWGSAYEHTDGGSHFPCRTPKEQMEEWDRQWRDYQRMQEQWAKEPYDPHAPSGF